MNHAKGPLATAAPFRCSATILPSLPAMTFETYDTGLCSRVSAIIGVSPSRAVRPSCETGTGDAILGIGRVAGTSNAKPSSPGRGGARNRADRVSLALSLRQAHAIIAAGQRAMATDRAFNRHVTIHWERAGIPDAGAAKATGDIIKLASDWVRRCSHPLLWCWVRENDAGNGSKGSHVHILLWCHPTMAIGRMWRRWIKRVSGRPYRAGTFKCRSVGGSLTTASGNPAVYAANLEAVTAYICKGIDPRHASTLGLTRSGEGGRVTGKRSAVCQALTR